VDGDNGDVDGCGLKPKTISKSDSARMKITECTIAASVGLFVSSEVVRRSSGASRRLDGDHLTRAHASASSSGRLLVD